MAKAGTLPAVERRLPEESMVVKPVHSMGKYGGAWWRGFTGPADGDNGNRIRADVKDVERNLLYSRAVTNHGVRIVSTR
jgi:hypothetical protein